MNWNNIETSEQLESIKTESEEIPVLIFKHSTTCPISALAISRFERAWKDERAGTLKPYYLDLLKYRPLSGQIAETFKVVHQSPQVLLIRNGRSIYDESHYSISFDEIIEKL